MVILKMHTREGEKEGEGKEKMGKNRHWEKSVSADRA